MARQRLRKRAFKALREGWRQGFRSVTPVDVPAKEVERPTLPAMAGEESVAEFVDGKLRSGNVPEHLRETWGLNDGKR